MNGVREQAWQLAFTGTHNWPCTHDCVRMCMQASIFYRLQRFKDFLSMQWEQYKQELIVMDMHVFIKCTQRLWLCVPLLGLEPRVWKIALQSGVRINKYWSVQHTEHMFPLPSAEHMLCMLLMKKLWWIMGTNIKLQCFREDNGDTHTHALSHTRMH